MEMQNLTQKVTAPMTGDDGEAMGQSENVVSLAVDVSPSKPVDAGWYVAVVRVNCERRIADDILGLLTDKNIWFEYWVPTVKVVTEDRRTKKRKKIDKIFLSTFIFCHISKRKLNEVRFRSDVYKMLTMPGCREIYRIPDHEIDNYRKFVENPYEPAIPQTAPLKKGQKVRITGGSMKGVEAYVQRVKGHKAIIGCEIKYIAGATIEIDRGWLEVVGK